MHSYIRTHSYFVAFFISLTALALFGLVSQASAACAAPTLGAAYTVSANCTFDGAVNGSDVGITVSTGVTLTANAGQTIVWAPGSSLVINGSVAISATGQLKQTYLWQKDTDADGYPDQTRMFTGDTAPAAGYTRRSLMTSYTTVDSYPSTSTCTTGSCSIAGTTPTTSTVFPDANPESTSVDGYAYRSTAGTWTDLVAGAGTAANDLAQGDAIINLETTATAPNWNNLFRSIFLFDTSGLPDTATISAATLSLYGAGKIDNLSLAPNVDIYTATPASNTAIVAGDYGQTQAVSQTGSPISYAGWSTTGYNDFVFNATGIGNISKTGVSKFSARNANYEVAGVTPTHPGFYGYSYLTARFADNTGGYPKPKLAVTYTVPETVTAATSSTCYIDGDGDGYGAGYSYTCSGTLPSGMVTNATDCNDATTTLYQNLTGYPDADSDTRYSPTSQQVCSGASLPSGYSSTVGTDCNDANAALYQNLTGYPDSDADTYYSAISQSVCSGASLPSGYSASIGTDCNDADAAKIMTCATVDSTGNVGDYNSMVLDSSGFPIIAYQDSSIRLKLVHCNDANCTGSNESIATVDTVAVGLGANTSVVLDSSGFPVISYNSHDGVGAYDLKIAHCNDVNCAGGNESIVLFSSPADVVGHYNSIRLDTSGFPVVSYQSATNLQLVHCNDANCAGSNESVQTIDSASTVGLYNSLVLDTSGFPVVSYYDGNLGYLKLAHCNDANCAGANESIVVVDATGVVGRFTSLVLDSSGFPVISYENATSADLKLVHCNDVNCAGGDESIVTVDSIGNLGWDSSIRLDSSGFPVISYRGTSTIDNLKLVHCNDANCIGGNESIVTVDPSGTVGYYNTSLRLDSSGFPVIGYYDRTNGDLQVAHCTNANCQ